MYTKTKVLLKFDSLEIDSDTCEVKMNVIALTRVRVPYFVVYTKTLVLFGSLEIVCME